MKQIIRLTESDLHRLVKESVYKILAETDASSSGDVNRPVFPMMRRPSPVGDPTDDVVKSLDPRPGISRDGGSNNSLAVNFANESIIREAVEENVRNWLLGAAMGLSLGTPGQANAQNCQQQNDTVQVDNSNDFTKQLRKSGKSEEEINRLKKDFNPNSIMYKNGKYGDENKKIRAYLESLNNISSSMLTDKIKCFNWREYDERQNYINQFDEETAKGYKCFYFLKNGYETSVFMPINYTLQDVQKELGTFQLGDYDIQ